MKMMSIADATSLGRRFDVFRQTSPPPDSFIERGLFPPLPVWRGDLVWGFGIVAAARRRAVSPLRSVSVEGTPEEAVCIALELEGRVDRYTVDEKSRILGLLSELGVDASSPRIAVLVQSSGSFVEQTRRYESLPAVVRRLVSAARLDLRSGYRLRRLPEAVWVAIESVERLTASETRIVATRLEEIRRRDGLNVRECVEIARKVLAAKDPVADSHRLRYPELSAMQERFDRLRRQALDGSGVRLEAPEGFEGASYHVSFDFFSRADFDRKLARLGGVAEVCDELFDLL